MKVIILFLYIILLACLFGCKRVNVIASTIINFGNFEQERRDTTIYLKNVGEEKLFVLDVIASCGCTVVEYDKHPVSSGELMCGADL
ncbi:DUF1573 domain-containing protein [uncultured Bacteroides sp.]|uniref:DUF1573 domain-containing protein n=1 Tax=uncultured Bacteroides sp. TaxID=162156 RepID=UPI0025DBF558|nr:DUF1573 domain-containing protein [uncultured Bacteroides sp.]